jgi:hypothetical protein
MDRLMRHAVLLAALAAWSVAATASTFLDVEAGAVYDSNLPRAQLARDVKSDTAARAAVRWGRFFVPADGLTLSASVDAGGELYARYRGLDNVALGGSAGVRRKFGLGALAPWVSVSGSLARLNYRNDVRDGWRRAAGIGIGKRPGESWELRAEFAYESRIADRETAVASGISGAVFDLQGRSLGLSGDLTLTERIALACGITLRRGDVASTTLRNRTIFTNSDAVTGDTVFGDNAVGYRIQATTRVYRLGASYALGVSNSANLNVERWVSRGAAGLDYFNTIVGLTYVHSL